MSAPNLRRETIDLPPKSDDELVADDELVVGGELAGDELVVGGELAGDDLVVGGELAGDELADDDELVVGEELLTPGMVLADRYCIQRQLGQGGMGTVYLAEHTRVGRSVAIKVLSSAWLGHPEISRRFREEARAASAAGHPNIIEVFDAGELPDGRPFIVMEYLEGRELLSVIQDRGLEVDEACSIVRDVALALSVAHARGVIHRDLKSENVIVREQGGSLHVKVLDFGIASLRNADDRPATMLGQVMGTPASMAPEQARGEPASEAFDIYALGILLHEALTGTVPFEPLGPQAMLMAKIGSPAPSVATVRADLHPDLIALVDQCLALAPKDRPSTADEVAERLQTLLDNASTAVQAAKRSTEVQVVVPTVAPTRTRGLVIPLLAAVAVMLAGTYALLDHDDGTQVSKSEVTAPPAAPPLEANGQTDGQTSEQTSEQTGGPTDGPAERLTPAPAEPIASPHLAPLAATTDSLPNEPRPQIDETDLPTVDPIVPKPSSAKSTGPCWLTRKRAHEARGAHDWSGVLKHTRSRACWAEYQAERTRLRTKAHMEAGDWSACIKTGRNHSDSVTRQWVKLCKRRKDQG